MQNKLSIATQRKILKLEQRIFNLKQQIVAMKTKHEKEIAKLKMENRKLRTEPIIIPIEKLREIQAYRKATLGSS